MEKFKKQMKSIVSKTKGMGLKKSQVWVETAIYALIGLTLISIILSIATPQIQKLMDKNIVDQTNSALIELNKVIFDVSNVVGNVRIVDFNIAKGKLVINPLENKISFILENTKLKLSEPNDPNEINPIIVKVGDISIMTTEYGERFNLLLELDYNNTLNLTQNFGNEVKILNAAGVPYRIKIENVGDNAIGARTHLDISVI